MYELSVLIPCFNDAPVLPRTVDELNTLVGHNSLNVECLIIDAKSTDDTLDVARNLIHQYPALHLRVLARSSPNRGYGSMIRYGLAHADATYAALVSADGDDPVSLLPEFLKHLRQGAHLVQCTRYTDPSNRKTVAPKFRLFQSIYRLLTRILLGFNISDTTYAFRAFDIKFVRAVGLFSNRFNLCPEMTFKVMLSGGKIAFVPGPERTPHKGGSNKFLLRAEVLGYAFVLFRAALHRYGITWF